MGKPSGWLILSTRIQRLSEIVDQIVDVFDAHRHPDQSSGDPERRALDRDQLAVGRASGKAGECFHTAKILRLSYDLPIMVENVDELAKIEAFFPLLTKSWTRGFVTIEKVRVIRYRHHNEGSWLPPNAMVG